MSQVQPAIHEAKGHLYYLADDERDPLVDYEPLDPYWALSKMLITEFDGYAELEDIEIDGEAWDIRLNYHKSGVRPRSSDPIDVERLYELDISVDGEGAERGGSYQIKPRFTPMHHYESGDVLTFPFHHVGDEGVTVQFQVSNMGFGEIASLFPRFLFELADAADMGLYHGYFDQPDGGRIEEVERYVRLSRSKNQKLIQRGGQFHRLAMLLSDVEGVSGEYKFDNEKTVGHLHAMRFGPTGARELIDYHSHGKQVKSYLPENPDAHDEGEPLYYPKLGALFRKSLNNGHSLRWEDRHDLLDELDETLLNLLAWAEIPTQPGATFISDDHFDGSAARSPSVPVYDDPCPRLEAKQEHLLVRTLRDMTDSDVDVLKTLATDGGQHVDELADQTGYSMSTIYRALQRLDGVVESKAGHVVYVSMKLAEEVRSIVDSLEEHVESAAQRAAHLVDMEVRQSASSSFQRWLDRYGAEFRSPASDGERPVVRIGTVLTQLKSRSNPMVEDVLEEMLSAWRDDCREIGELLNAIVSIDLANGDTLQRSVRSLR
jgi:predicted transcriptional regulator